MKNSKLDKRFFHRLFLLFIILLLPMFIVREYKVITAKKDTRILPAQDFFQAQLLENNNKRFTVIVLTQNAGSTIEKNFQAIVNQKYPNFDVVYVDQASGDGTVASLHELLAKSTNGKKVRVIETHKDYEGLQAYFNTIYALDNEQVVVQLSGNDILAHDEVLNLIDQTYTNPDVWMTYGQYIDSFHFEKGIHKPKPQKILCKKKVHRAPWLSANVKTFYAGHFKKIKKDQLIDQFVLSLENEESFLKPLAEMGKAHVQFIPDVLSIHHVKQSMKKREMKLSKRAEEYTQVVHESLAAVEKGVDVVIFSENRPHRLVKCLESIKGNMKGLGKISIIYTCDEKSFAAYEKIQAAYGDMHFFRQTAQGNTSLKQTFFEVLTLEKGGSPYVLLSSDQTIVHEEVILSPCIEAMRKSGAYAFYLHLGKKEHLDADGIFSWVVDKGEAEWREPNVFKMTLYRKVDLERDFKKAHFNTINEWIEIWSKREASHFGLSFEKSKTQ